MAWDFSPRHRRHIPCALSEWEADGISARFQKNFVNPLDKRSCLWYNINVRRGVAQFGRVLGSGPRGRWFKSSHSDPQKDVRMDVLFLLFTA